ncbi:MAG: polymer-forming cytoskeletal protein [Leptolyngbya sp. PLA3]|nr:MAG: polymer-forming cytoskeletal protein [Cyanobacteria bacterium CYA]MCE7968659.1 polymer-forming cytoskeletal protein [Leptolyngbya sp. PL-A3]
MAQNNSEMTVIGRDTRIKGEMFFESGARILGSFEGKISSAGEVQIGAGANCQASIEASRVSVDGNITGDIAASELLTLNASAHIQGDVTAGKLVVLEGATFVGHCRVGCNSAAAAANGVRTGTTPTLPARPARPVPEMKPTAARPPRELELAGEEVTSEVA